MFIPLERSALAGAALSSRAMDFDLAKLDNDLDTPSLVIALLVFAVICGLFGALIGAVCSATTPIHCFLAKRLFSRSRAMNNPYSLSEKADLEPAVAAPICLLPPMPVYTPFRNPAAQGRPAPHVRRVVSHSSLAMTDRLAGASFGGHTAPVHSLSTPGTLCGGLPLSAATPHVRLIPLPPLAMTDRARHDWARELGIPCF